MLFKIFFGFLLNHFELNWVNFYVINAFSDVIVVKANYWEVFRFSINNALSTDVVPAGHQHRTLKHNIELGSAQKAVTFWLFNVGIPILIFKPEQLLLSLFFCAVFIKFYVLLVLLLKNSINLFFIIKVLFFISRLFVFELFSLVFLLLGTIVIKILVAHTYLFIDYVIFESIIIINVLYFSVVYVGHISW